MHACALAAMLMYAVLALTRCQLDLELEYHRRLSPPTATESQPTDRPTDRDRPRRPTDRGRWVCCWEDITEEAYREGVLASGLERPLHVQLMSDDPTVVVTDTST